MDSLYVLVSNAQNKDKNSLVEILNKFHPLIKKYTRKLNYDDAESELTIALIETILYMPIFNKSYLKKDEAIIGYVIKSIRNKYIYLSEKNTKILRTQTELDLDICSDKYYIESDDLILIRSLLSKLSELQKRIIIQKYFYKCSDVEIAKNINVSRQAVNRIKNRALKNMRNELNLKNSKNHTN